MAGGCTLSESLRGRGSDWLLVMALVLAWGWAVSRGNEPASVSVYREGQRVGTWPLPQHGERTLVVEGRLGPVRILLSPNGVRIADAPCSRRYCVASGWHIHPGDAAVCVPSRIVVRVNGAHHAVDAVVQ